MNETKEQVNVSGSSSEDKIKEAKRLIQEEEQKRMKACFEEVSEILKKYNCVLDVTPPQIILLPNKTENSPNNQ